MVSTLKDGGHLRRSRCCAQDDAGITLTVVLISGSSSPLPPDPQETRLPWLARPAGAAPGWRPGSVAGTAAGGGRGLAPTLPAVAESGPPQLTHFPETSAGRGFTPPENTRPPWA